MRISLIATAFIATLLLSAVLVWQYVKVIPEPPYSILSSNGSIQIRKYKELILAETQIPGERYAALIKGKTKIISSIQGLLNSELNLLKRLPVSQQRVHVYPHDQEHYLNDEHNKWIVRIIIPDSILQNHSLGTVDKAVKLKKLDPYKMAVIQFNGMNRDSNLVAHLEKLEAFIRMNQLKTVGHPFLIFYNSAWTIPFFRRNEIMFELA